MRKVRLYVAFNAVVIEVDGEPCATLSRGDDGPSDALRKLALALGADVQTIFGRQPEVQR